MPTKYNVFKYSILAICIAYLLIILFQCSISKIIPEFLVRDCCKNAPKKLNFANFDPGPKVDAVTSTFKFLTSETVADISNAPKKFNA